MYISQSKSMELDALCEEEDKKSLYMVHQAELEKSKLGGPNQLKLDFG